MEIISLFFADCTSADSSCHSQAQQDRSFVLCGGNDTTLPLFLCPRLALPSLRTVISAGASAAIYFPLLLKHGSFNDSCFGVSRPLVLKAQWRERKRKNK